MTADTVGGVWTYALELAGALAPHGVEITLLAMGDSPSESQRRAAGRLANLVLHEAPSKLEWMAQPQEDLRRADDLLLDLEAKLGPDLVHINGFANAAAGFAAPVVVVAHSCVDTWWRACRGAHAPADWNDYRVRLRQGLRAADALVAPTQAFLDSFLQAHGPRPDALVIPNGRDPSTFAPRPKQMFALAAGRLWDEAKNLAALAAASQLCGADIRVAGGGGEGAVAGRLHLLGVLDAPALAAEMGRAAVFAAPARYEPFGLAVLEAALSGCALVLGDIPTLRELWDGAARFVDPGDAPELARAIEDLLADPRAAGEAGAAARTRAARYSAAAMGAAYLGLYRSLRERSVTLRAEELAA